MLRRLFGPILVGCALVLGAGCMTRGSGVRGEETRAIEAFAELEVSGSLDVFLQGGEAPYARVVGDDNLVPLVETELVGDTLRVHVRGSYMTGNALEVHLTAPDPSRIALSGSGRVDARSVTHDTLELALSGSGHMKIAGTTSTLTIGQSGSGDLDATGLDAEDVKVSLAGSGTAAVTATKSLSADVSGSGSVRYRGNPADVDESVSGSGSVRPL